MTWPTNFDPNRIDLHVADRISPADARRQMVTAAELLRRLQHQPGVVLADEVGMGKTFVALAVAVSAMWADKSKRPVIVMVPSSVAKKWQRDLDLFRNRCIRQEADRAFRCATAENALAFFRLLDDPPKTRARIIFLTHGAFHRSIQDPWVKLAILKRAMHHARLGADRRKAIARFAPDILRQKSARLDEALYTRLIAEDVGRWRNIISKFGTDLEDDPVPAAIDHALEASDPDLSALRDALDEMPLRDSANLKDRLHDVRQMLDQSFQSIWKKALKSALFRAPLLVLDEAHHAKNPATKLASLFVSKDAEDDAGALEGGFERMLFLTATPFQLGHTELLNVVDRFQGVEWGKSLPGLDRAAFLTQLDTLRRALDKAQSHAVTLDQTWGRLRSADLGESEFTDALDHWWDRALANPDGEPERVQQVVRSFHSLQDALSGAEKLLRPWVVRHLRARTLVEGSPVLRRTRRPGNAIRSGDVTDRAGIAITDSALLPFLLAARAQAMVAHIAREKRDVGVYRATFAEGLASSYEAFHEPREHDPERDEAAAADTPNDERIERCLGRLRAALPEASSFAEHPKIAATVDRVVDLWERGEKVLVFCHFRKTGRALTDYISAALERRLWQGGVQAPRPERSGSARARRQLGQRLRARSPARPSPPRRGRPGAAGGRLTSSRPRPHRRCHPPLPPNSTLPAPLRRPGRQESPSRTSAGAEDRLRRQLSARPNLIVCHLPRRSQRGTRQLPRRPRAHPPALASRAS